MGSTQTMVNQRLDRKAGEKMSDQLVVNTNGTSQVNLNEVRPVNQWQMIAGGIDSKPLEPLLVQRDDFQYLFEVIGSPKADTAKS